MTALHCVAEKLTEKATKFSGQTTLFFLTVTYLPSSLLCFLHHSSSLCGGQVRWGEIVRANDTPTEICLHF